MKETLKHDLTIPVGADYQVDFIYEEDDGTVVDVSDWTVESQIREYPEANDCIEFTCTADEDGFHLTLSAEETEQLTFSQGVYDVFITSPSEIYRTKLVKGRVLVDPDTTR